jgi:hypothetical protein
VSDPAGTLARPDRDPALAADAGTPARRSRWSSLLRITFEFALLFAIALVAKLALSAVATGAYPNPLWLPVIVLSLQHGMAAGLGASVIAAGIQYWEGLPPAFMHEDMYAYIGRITAEPVGWSCVALLIGHIRSRQIANTAELERELEERSRQCAAVAELCVDLRSRTELLERHIAANAHASNNDIVQALSELNQATWENFLERLARFVNLMTGATDFSIHLVRGDALEVTFQPKDDHRLAAATAVGPNDPVFAAIVNEQRLLSAAKPDDAALLDNRWILAGGLRDQNAPDRVIGMFAIAGAALDDHPDDIERRFALTCAEISRLVGHFVVIDDWHAAQAPRQANRRDLAEQMSRPDDVSPRPTVQAGKAWEGRAKGQQAATMR